MGPLPTISWLATPVSSSESSPTDPGLPLVLILSMTIISVIASLLLVAAHIRFAIASGRNQQLATASPKALIK